jgi:hypothetical protein
LRRPRASLLRRHTVSYLCKSGLLPASLPEGRIEIAASAGMVEERWPGLLLSEAASTAVKDALNMEAKMGTV